MEIPYVCPYCKGDLSKEPKAYFCHQCSRKYPVVLDIPDFRVFADPYVSVEDEYRKARAITENYDQMSFRELVAHYWNLTPGVPESLKHEFIRLALNKRDQSLNTWDTIESIIGQSQRDTLLEVGCSTAGFLAAVSPAVTHGVGVDIAFRWLVIARKRLEESGAKNVTLVCACAEFLPFPADVFDYVAAEDVLDHTKDQRAFVGESARVLKPETGTFYISTPNRYSLGPDPHVWVWGVGYLPARFRDNYVRWRKGVPYGPIRPVSYARLRSLLRSVGLHQFRTVLPDLRGLDLQKLSRWRRIQVRAYELIRGIPLLRGALRLIGPSFQVVCHKTPAN